MPRLPEKLATIRQTGHPRFQIAGIPIRPEKHVRKGFAHVDHSNDRTVVVKNNKAWIGTTMARRRQSPLEDLMDISAHLPWKVGVVLALIAYLIFHYFA